MLTPPITINITFSPHFLLSIQLDIPKIICYSLLN